MPVHPKNKIIEGDLTATSGPVRFDGRVELMGSVKKAAEINALGDVMIHGNVEGGIVRSREGNIDIQGGIFGSSKIKCFGDLRVNSVQSGQATAGGSVYIRDAVIDSVIKATNLVHVDGGEGLIDGGEVSAGVEIAANVIGSKLAVPTTVRIENYGRKEAFEVILLYDHKIQQKLDRLRKLERTTEIIRLLGKRVVSLPPLKKAHLATQAKEYNDIKNDILSVKQEKEKVLSDRGEKQGLRRAVCARREVHPGVKVSIDGKHFQVKDPCERVIFYKRGMIIMGDLDKFRERQRR